MRDKRKPISYFNDGIIAIKKNIEIFNGYIEDNSDDKEYVQRIKQHSYSHLEDLYNIYYSIGGNKETIRNEVIDCIIAFDEGGYIFENEAGFLDFETTIWLVSLAILCDIEDEKIDKLVKKIKALKIKDKLIDFLIKYKDSDWKSTSNQFHEKLPYESLSTILDTTDEKTGINLLKNYLEKKWYQGHKKRGTNWVDNHLGHENAYAYFGYWCWEAAAIVKIKGWNDDTLKGLDYYPYDAVHWE